MPLLGMLEPYTALVKGIRRVTLMDEAVAEFAYDWRLPVRHNAERLAEAAHNHLKAWRLLSGSPSARLVLVAHSMGGLLARALGLISGANDDIRAIITLGTPFYGSVKAVLMLGSGCGVPLPLPRRRLQRVAATLPGVHDLLPTYLCVDTGDDFTRLSPAQVAELGGDLELAQNAAALQRRLSLLPLPGHRAIMGVRQPTPQSLEIRDGIAYARFYAARVRDHELLRDEHGRPRRFDRYGDGTVYRDAATLISDFHLSAQHGSLARNGAVIDQVCDILTEDEQGPPMGGGLLGLHVPDVVTAGSPWRLWVSGTPYATSVTCTVTNAVTGREVSWPDLRATAYTATAGNLPGDDLGHERADVVNDPGSGEATGLLNTEVTLATPGLYRVTAEGGGGAPIAQLVLATEPTADDPPHIA